ncbi:SAF domain-containing protein [Actinomadura rupiterrae]|uniref:SAF domain-containing protein n=1 Tax=Actinomadura rupiterrae TaxID=559627 RepID=UPI003558CE9A|nr:hypothetical protein [Actinomadura rupiterrae]
MNDGFGRKRRLLAALFAALGTGLVLLSIRPSAPRTVHIAVASRDLAAGATLRPSDIRIVALPPAVRPDGALRDPPVGHVLSGAVRRGEALTDARLLGPGLLDQQPPGTVATPIRVADAASARLLRPGDRIDVLTATPPGSSQDPPPVPDESAPGPSPDGPKPPPPGKPSTKTATPGINTSPVPRVSPATKPVGNLELEPPLAAPALPAQTPRPIQTWPPTSIAAASTAPSQGQPDALRKQQKATALWIQIPPLQGHTAARTKHRDTTPPPPSCATPISPAPERRETQFKGSKETNLSHCQTNDASTGYASAEITSYRRQDAQLARTEDGLRLEPSPLRIGLAGWSRVVVSSAVVLAVPHEESGLGNAGQGALVVLATSRAQAAALAGAGGPLLVTLVRD